MNECFFLVVSTAAVYLDKFSFYRRIALVWIGEEMYYCIRYCIFILALRSWRRYCNNRFPQQFGEKKKKLSSSARFCNCRPGIYRARRVSPFGTYR